MKSFFKKLLWFLLITSILIAILFLLRFRILRAAGNFLIKEDKLEKVDATFVLGAHAFDRAKEAAHIYNQKKTPKIVTSGGVYSEDFKIHHKKISLAEIAQQALLNRGVDTAAIHVINRGTSTFEESEIILGYASQQGYKKIAVVSSAFHTRRVGNVFHKKFKKEGIKVIVRGAEPTKYSTDAWWEEEEGLIFVNNEYVKLIYYMLKY